MPSATFIPPYFYNEHQKEPRRGATSAEEGAASAAHAVTQYQRQVSLQLFNGSWRVNNHDGNGWQLPADDTGYEPQFRVAGVSIRDENTDGRIIQFDMPRSQGCTERLIFGIDRPYHITKLYLRGSETDATYINLWG